MEHNLTPEQIKIGKNFTSEQIEAFNTYVRGGDDAATAFALTLQSYPIKGVESPEVPPAVGQRIMGAVEGAAELIGGSTIARGAGQLLAGGEISRLQAEADANAEQVAQNLLKAIREAREAGDSERVARLTNALQELEFGTIQADYVESLPEDREVVGDALRLAGTATGAFAGLRAAGALGGGAARVGALSGLTEGAITGAFWGAGEGVAEGEDPLEIALRTLGGAAAGGALGAGLGGAVGGAISVAPAVGRAAGRQSQRLRELFRRAPGTPTGTPPPPGGGTPSGIGQIVSELAERPSRGLERVQENIADAATRAERIRTSTPTVGRAIRNYVDIDLLDQIGQADQQTLRSVQRGLEMAQSNRGASNIFEPLGEDAVSAYNRIDAERRRVGRLIGDEVEKLARDESVNLDLDKRLMKLFADNDITLTFDPRDPLNFGTGFTENQRNAITKLYNEATRRGTDLTPRDIYNLDRVFSTMKRESAVIDKIDNVMFNVEQPDGTVVTRNAFDAVRDIFSDTLESINPRIRELNREYRPLRVMVDDLEETIFRNTQDLDSLRDLVGKEDFFPNAVRRAFSNAVTAPSYRGMLRKLDTDARALGYDGANLEEAGDILLRLLRDYFPEGEQLTGLRSQVTLPGAPSASPRGLIDIAGRVLDFGRVTRTDQQRAILEVIKEALQ